MRNKIAYIIKHNKTVQFLYTHILSALFRFIGLFVHTDENLVLFNSFGGEQYSDSSRILYEQMLRDDRFNRFHFVWAFENPRLFDENTCPNVHNKRTNLITIDTPAYFLAALKAKIWITNVNIERGLHFKKRNTIYLNTWHGTAPKLGGNLYKGRKDYDFSYIDILCVDGDYEKERMLKMFNANANNFLMCGRPREDELLAFTDNDKERLRKKIGIDNDKKVILYMPTWREGINHGLEWDKWKQRLGNDYVILVRAHHFSKVNIFSEHGDGFWIDVSNYSNVNELYFVADILISDYSSAIFDYGLLGRPIISFAKDHEEYMRETGLYMTDWNERVPHGVMRTDEQVISFIENMDYKEESAVSKAFVDSIVSHPGNATSTCLDRLHALLNQ